MPKNIQEHVDYITPGIKLHSSTKRGHEKRGQHGHGLSRPAKNISPAEFQPSATNPLATCDVAITPACIRALYEVPQFPHYSRGVANPNNSMGIFEEGDFYSQEDLNLFFANFTSYIPNGTHPTPAFIDGANIPANAPAGGESDLDFELAYPLIYPQTITLYQTDDYNYATGTNSTSSGGFNTFLDAIDGSYCTYSAFGETGDDATLDPTYPDPAPGGYKGKLQYVIGEGFLPYFDCFYEF